jgi:hypothetical protein
MPLLKRATTIELGRKSDLNNNLRLADSLPYLTMVRDGRAARNETEGPVIALDRVTPFLPTF